jgi:glycerate kinase
VEHPVSDGGEGLVDVLAGAMGGAIVATEVVGPLPGQRVTAQWGISPDGSTAIIEMAQAAGLLLVSPGRRDPRIATTYGVGELIRAALDRGVRSLIIGIGGSATNDGGAGMAEALGARFFDSAGAPLERGGAHLKRLAAIDLQNLDPRLASVTVDVACDVRNPLLGEAGASAVYGPQKGASPEDVLRLDEALAAYRDVIRETLGIDVQVIPGSGAAGGLGAGLAAFCHARLRRGIDIVLDATGFDERLRAADLVITGEGTIDAQTWAGKAISGILERAHRVSRPVVAVVGIMAGRPDDFLGEGGLLAITQLVNASTPQENAMHNAPGLLQIRTRELLSHLPGVSSPS